MSQTANITVYLQALGAHYLGAHAYMVNTINIKLVYTGGTVVLPYVADKTSNDGKPQGSFTTGTCSFMPIITIPQSPAQPSTLVNFLAHDNNTVCGQANFILGATTELAQLQISVPTPASAAPLQFTQSVLLIPTQSNYSITVAIPGLYLSPGAISNTGLSVYVKMMCGCPVTMGPPASLWPANDFTVYANVVDATGTTTSYPLSYDLTQATNSLFSIVFTSALTAAIKSVSFSAIQKSTGNYGTLVVQG